MAWKRPDNSAMTSSMRGAPISTRPACCCRTSIAGSCGMRASLVHRFRAPRRVVRGTGPPSAHAGTRGRGHHHPQWDDPGDQPPRRDRMGTPSGVEMASETFGPVDRRGPAGPGHVAQVRETMFDLLSPRDVAVLEHAYQDMRTHILAHPHTRALLMRSPHLAPRTSPEPRTAWRPARPWSRTCRISASSRARRSARPSPVPLDSSTQARFLVDNAMT
jgi:hypothetical protein